MTKSDEGDIKWVLELGTRELTASGIKIPTQIVHNIVEKNIEDEIEKSVSQICTYVDWGDFESDNEAPYINTFYPIGSDVSINSTVTMNVVEDLPAAGIDLSEATIVFNNGEVDFDITNEINVEGDPYDYKISWKSPNKVI